MTFDQLYNLVSEQSNPIQPVNLPSPEEQAQKQQAFQQQQQKSVQDVKSLGSGLLDVAKFLDPTGILSWDDVKKAQEAFKKDPSATNGLMYMLAIGSVIPAVGKGPKALKTAIRGGQNIDRPIRNFVEEFYTDMRTGEIRSRIVEKGLDQNQIQNAYNVVQSQQRQLADELAAYTQKMQSQGFKQLTPETHYKRPTARQFGGNIVERNFFPNVPAGYYTKNSAGGKIYIESPEEAILRKRMNARADELKAAAGPEIWDDSLAKTSIKLLDRQNYSGRDVIEINIPFGIKKPNGEIVRSDEKVIMYKSLRGTDNKKKDYWYPILGFTDSWFIKSDKGVDLTEYSSPFFKGLAEYLLRYGPEGLRQ